MSKRGIFLAYCAYAPFIQAIGSLYLWMMGGCSGDPNSAVWIALLMVAPLSIWFILETTVFHCDVLASHCSFASHAAVYSYFYVTSVMGEINGSPAPLPTDQQALPIIMVALSFASLALLMTWDNMRRKQGSSTAAPESSE